MTNPTRVIAAIERTKKRNEVRKQLSPLVQQYQEWISGRPLGSPLPRDPMTFLDAQFGPLAPIMTMPLNPPLEGDERGANRQREMPVGWNMPVGVPGSEGFKLASFGTLRMYADLYSVARACIQVRKSEIRGLEWDVMPTQQAEKAMQGDKEAHRDFAERRTQVVKFFRRPDPEYTKFGSWIDAVIEEMLVVDALSLYIHPTVKKGKGPFNSSVASLELIAGHTIRPLVNTRGGRPAPPSPAYQQYLYGVPRTDMMTIINRQDEDQLRELKPLEQYRGDQLMYVPYTQRSWTPYGFPPLERAIIPTITGLRRQQYQMDFFDEGTIPGNYISPGENVGWTPNQLQIWQDQQNALAGDPAWKHKSVALPPGSRVFPMRPVDLADQFDEIIMTQMCMAYDVMPMELGISPKVSTTQSPGAANQMAKASKNTQQRKSLKPTLAFLTDIFNTLIQDVWDQQDMRFVFEGLEENEDEDALVSRLVQMVSFGLAPIDEGRIALGKAPYGLPITSDPVFVSATAGMVPLGSIDPTTGKPMGTPPPAAIGAPPPPGGGPPGAPPGSPGPQGAPGKPPAGQPPASATPRPPGAPGSPEPQSPHDQAMQAHSETIQQHQATVRERVHEQAAAGKPMEPIARPPITDASQSVDAEVHAASTTGGMKAILAELGALERHLGKGRDVNTWEFRHVPEWAQYGLTKGTSPATIRAMLGKAGGADPKVPGTTTTAWRVWDHDKALGEIYGRRLNDAIVAAVPVHDVVFGWIVNNGASHSHPASLAGPAVVKASPMEGDSAWSWLNAKGYFAALVQAIRKVLTDLWLEGFALGQESAREVIDSGYHSSFWDDWTPGDPEAADHIAGDGLQHMLDDYGIATIKSIADTRMTQLADALAVGIDQGWSGEQIADEIRPILDAPQRAQMIADTELARAVSTATMDQYYAANQPYKKWSLTPDDRVCMACQANKDGGPVPIGALFPSGAVAPPAHPNCRCAVLPSDAPALAGVAKAHPKVSPESVHLRQATGPRDCGGCAMFHPLPADFETGKCDILVNNVDEDQVCDRWVARTANKSKELEAAGLAVRAANTGRVLMLQRALSEDDPAGGFWEFPGGRLDGNETPEQAARREWTEETGLRLPASRVPVTTWDDGVYRCYVVEVPNEDDVPILDRQKGVNPDDPDNDETEALAWWDPKELKDNPLVRPELQEHPKRVRRALTATTERALHKASPTRTVPAATVFDQLAINYPPKSIEWVRRATWTGPADVPWSEIDHDDMDKWAASHQRARVAEFERKIKDGAADEHPVVLVADPDGNYIDVDGHHRALAYHNLNMPIRAWIGRIDPADRHAMEETHVYQDHAGADPLDKLAVPSLVKVGPKGYIHGWIYVGPGLGPGSSVELSHPEHGWVKVTAGDKDGLAKVTKSNGTTFQVTHQSHLSGANAGHNGFYKKPSQAPAGYCHDHCGNKTKGGAYLPGHDAKHVAMLAAAVKSGELDPLSAYDELHSEKLQHKLEMHIGPGAGKDTYAKPQTDEAKAFHTGDHVTGTTTYGEHVTGTITSVSGKDTFVIGDDGSGHEGGWVLQTSSLSHAPATTPATGMGDHVNGTYMGDPVSGTVIGISHGVPGGGDLLSVKSPDGSVYYMNSQAIHQNAIDPTTGKQMTPEEHMATLGGGLGPHDFGATGLEPWEQELLAAPPYHDPGDPNAAMGWHEATSATGNPIHEGDYVIGYDAGTGETHYGQVKGIAYEKDGPATIAFADDSDVMHYVPAYEVEHQDNPALLEDEDLPEAPAGPTVVDGLHLDAPGQDLHDYGSTTPDGRAWQTHMEPGGVGSHYTIEAKPGTGPNDPFRNQRMRLVYKGNGAVDIQRNPTEEDKNTWVTSTPTSLTALAAGHKSKVWQHAAKQLQQAQKNEEIAKASAKQLGLDKPKPVLAAVVDEASKPGKPIKPAKQDLTGASGVTDSGRPWVAFQKENGIGSTFQITPGQSGGYIGNYHWRATYIGGKKVRMEYSSNGDGPWNTYYGDTTVQRLNLGYPIPGSSTGYGKYKQQSEAYKDFKKPLYEAMLKASRNEQAQNKHDYAVMMASATGGTWMPGTGVTDTKVGQMFHDTSNPAPHMANVSDLYGNAANKAKAKVSHRISEAMTTPTDEIWRAAYGLSSHDQAAWNQRTNSKAWVKLNPTDGHVSYDMGSMMDPAAQGYFKANSPEGDKVFREAAVGQMVHNWAITSNDDHKLSIALQEAAVREFGLQGTADAPSMMKHDHDDVQELLSHSEQAYRQFLRVMYNLTQQDLKERGITHVQLWRGMGWQYGGAPMPHWASILPKGVPQNIPVPPQRPMSSWAYQKHSADSFGGQVMLSSIVPADAILGYPQSGFGCFRENEFVVLGGQGGLLQATKK